MVDQKVAESASQAAAHHIGELIASAVSGGKKDATVYAEVYKCILNATALDPEAVRARVVAYVEKHYPEKDVLSVTGNIMKESTNPNMGQKVFVKLITALFPTE